MTFEPAGGNHWIAPTYVENSFQLVEPFNGFWTGGPPTAGCAGGCFNNGTIDAYTPNTSFFTAVGGEDFTFNSFDLSYGLMHADGGAFYFSVSAYHDGLAQNIWTTTLDYSTGGFFTVALNWENVDQVAFTAWGNSYTTWYGLDNLTVNQPQPVPEPASLVLFATALVGIAHKLRR